MNRQQKDQIATPDRHESEMGDGSLPTIEERTARLLSESLISLAEAARVFPPGRNGKPTHISTLIRWIQGRRLDGVSTGGRWMTSREAIARFLAASTAQRLSRPDRAVGGSRSASIEQRRQQDQVEAKLAAMGV